MILLDDLVTYTSADVLAEGARSTLTGFAHDSRMAQPGDCFVAVRGMHGDGHDYAHAAADHGAAALLLERGRVTALRASQPELLERLRQMGVAVLVVDDTREALRRYAASVLAAWKPIVIAVTGATGKTTTKEAIADVLATQAPTFRSWRNYNDLLGLPLSLGRLEPEHRYAVVELGADHPGELRDLCALARPRIGVVTNVSPTHLQYFASIEELASEYAELPRALPTDGIAILNRDDARVCAMAHDALADTAFFGLTAEVPGDVPFTLVPLGTRGSTALALRPNDAAMADALTFPELHSDAWATAVLAALSVATALGVAHSDALDVLRRLRPLPGRMRWLEGRGGLVLLDDSHNATPASAEAGLRALAAIAAARGAARIAVLGDMLRLGAAEADAHQRLGTLAATCANYLVTHGPRAEQLADAAAQAGLPTTHIAVTYTAEDAASAVEVFASGLSGPAESATPTCCAVVYIKGSEEMRMERVTGRLLLRPEEAPGVLDRQTSAWRRIVVTRPDRPTWLEIDLSAIGENTRRLAQIVSPRVAVLVSLKADAYGHGALRVARTVLNNGASWLGVATVSEAQQLRTAGITEPILVFGYTAPWQAREAVALNLRATVFGLDSARALSRAATDLRREVRVHIKIDTGMARLGVRAENPADVVAFVEAVRALPGLIVEGVFTHFATADSSDQSYAHRQLARFHAVLSALDAHGIRPPIVHAANSAALLSLPEARFDMVRPGIAVYGLAPSEDVPLPPGFRPALSFKTQVAQVKEIPAGEGVSYGATYITTQPTKIAVLPVGYADGFRRGPQTWGEVLVRGQRAPLVGRVCMDQCMIDVTGVAGVRQGDEVVLIGQQEGDEITATDVARRLGTISYEVVAEILARVPRIS